ncbi:helix-turn-helix domain-containing protein [Anabaenopsis tanganyikae CS-531]|uniref:Helix-turn-helix domain-containing protein n=2 Tax=Anabaenopsis TaxID=110103 RepID=A0ABT6KI61_9CYAN|nr:MULTISPECIES: helix-turn-helix domain-containing protein [Anabaenopsis]MDB9538761.1 helix-turn-helix domain-containing protein [Anabaenopsis arnoldii]MDH6091038.1 helix-turn-helix domain-containing protein [Anabaenopsis arnoldii]MDH6107461.1 helix-turn-helix domain-containing protein [Anabaenopsis tanganyikae CS-531]
MLLGFKTQLKVNKQQGLLLGQHAGVARQVCQDFQGGDYICC